MKVQGSTKHSERVQRDDRFDMESLVGYILLTGVLLSAALLAVGFVWRWLRVGNLRFEHSIVGMNFFEFISSTLRQMASRAFRPRLFPQHGNRRFDVNAFCAGAGFCLLFRFRGAQLEVHSLHRLCPDYPYL